MIHWNKIFEILFQLLTYLHMCSAYNVKDKRCIFILVLSRIIPITRGGAQAFFAAEIGRPNHPGALPLTVECPSNVKICDLRPKLIVYNHIQNHSIFVLWKLGTGASRLFTIKVSLELVIWDLILTHKGIHNGKGTKKGNVIQKRKEEQEQERKQIQEKQQENQQEK